MSKTSRVVKLLENHIYPTYQLFATMSNRKTNPQDGLRLGALTVMEWLRQRLGDNSPNELIQPEPERFMEVGDECLVSLHLNRGFVIDIVSLPSQGIWSLQITEPDLGSNPGTTVQRRSAVPGRVIETNVGFTIHGTELECGFQTIISDPIGTEVEAEVYRLAIIRRLIDNPYFGLKQMIPLSMTPTNIVSNVQLKQLLSVAKSEENQLPCVVFTYLHEAPTELPDLSPIALKFPAVQTMAPHISFAPILQDRQSIKHNALIEPKLSKKEKVKVEKNKPLPCKAILPNYDIEKFAQKKVSFCRTYLLADSLFEQLVSSLDIDAQHGDIFVLEPVRFAAHNRVIPYKSSKIRQEEIIHTLSAEMYSYPKGKNISFGKISFLSAARESLFRTTSSAIHHSEAISLEWNQKFSIIEAQTKDILRKKDDEYALLSAQLDRQKIYQSKMESEASQLRKKFDTESEKYNAQLNERDTQIVYLKRKISQPKAHTDIVSWVKSTFSDNLMMHDRTISLLADKSARSVDIELICDALDYLATDYWKYHYQVISKDEMLRHCSDKYGRPFEIKPTGSTTISFTPSQYHVKYLWSNTSQAMDSPLDFHLCVGNDPENLLRIYFFHDDERQKIVIASLPGHLRSVTIQ